MKAKTAFFLLICAAFVVVGCAPPKAKTKSFQVKPQAPDPTVRVNWSTRLDDFEFFTKIPTQFAKPKHVPTTDELVVATANGEIIKFQASNGKKVWSKWIDASISAQPGFGAGFVIIADLSGKVRALEVSNGDEAWTFQAQSSFETPPTIAEGRILLTDATDTLYALDVTTGEELWRFQRKPPEFFTIQGAGRPAVKDGEVYCGFADGFLVALQLETGEELWRADLTGGAEKFMDVDGDVFVTDSLVYAASFGGGVYALDRFSGEIIWRNPVASVARMQSYEYLLYVTSSLGRVVAIDSETGKSVWSFKFKDASPDHLQPYGPYLVVATEKPLYVLDRATGYPLHIFRGTAGFTAGIEFGGDRLYTFSDHGRVTAFKFGW